MLILGYVDYIFESYKGLTVQEIEPQIQEEITPEIKALLDHRLAEYEKNPQNVVTWDEVKAKFNKKYGYAI